MRSIDSGKISYPGGAVTTPTLDISTREDAVVAKVIGKIVPLAMLGLFVSFIDRTNIAVAGPDMSRALGLTPTTFGLAAGLFFIGYVIFEIPSNLALRRFGAKVWISRIMVTWGLICMVTALVRSAASLDAMRFVLGVGEAGFYPGVLFYLSLFIPARQITKAYALYQVGIPVSLALGSVMTAAILLMDGVLGISGWQWVFLIEGGLAIAVGIFCYVVMADTPEKARWLDPEERALLSAAVARDHKQTVAHDEHGLSATMAILRNPQVWYYCAVYTCMMLGFYSVTYWLPQIIKLKFAVGAVEAGLLSAIPWMVATIALFLVSRFTSTRHGRRGPMLTAILVITAVGMLLSSLADDPVIAFIGLCMGACIQAAVPLLYSFLSQHFPGAKVAVALALVNSIGNIGGFFGPTILGLLRGATSTDTAGLLVLSSAFLIGALLSLGLPAQLRKSPAYVSGVG